MMNLELVFCHAKREVIFLWLVTSYLGTYWLEWTRVRSILIVRHPKHFTCLLRFIDSRTFQVPLVRPCVCRSFLAQWWDSMNAFENYEIADICCFRFVSCHVMSMVEPLFEKRILFHQEVVRWRKWWQKEVFQVSWKLNTIYVLSSLRRLQGRWLFQANC